MSKFYLSTLLAAALLAFGGGDVQAQTDVTSTYITNGDFETGDALTTVVQTYNKNIKDNQVSGMQAVTGWTASVPGETSKVRTGNGDNDARAAGVFSYGETAGGIGSAGNVPKSDKNGNTSGKCLGMLNVWGNDAYYSSPSVTLDAGTYKLSVDVYCMNKNSGLKTNKIGFVPESGTASYGSTTKFTVNGWTTETVTFTLDAQTTGNITLGYTAGSVGSSDATILFFDNITLTQALSTIDADKSYYIQNVGSGKYLAGANSWGTQASVVDEGEQFKFVLTSGGYYIEDQALSSSNKRLGSGLYTDNTGVAWKITPVEGETGEYTISYGGKYLAQSATAGLYSGYVAELVDNVADAAKWYIITKADAITKLSSATGANPISATFLIGDADFSRNHTSSAWTTTNSPTLNQTKDNGDGTITTNFVSEAYRKVFSLSQELTGMPNGYYKLSAQGFYRQDGTDNTNLPYFYINDEKVTFPVITGSENDMASAGDAFTNGSYKIESNLVKVTDGNITIGAKLETNKTLWCIWDNFDLTYYGSETTKDVLNQYVANANATLSDANYANIKWDARNTFSNAITTATDATGEYETAISTLLVAQSTFTAAKASYDAFAAAQALAGTDGANLELPYASNGDNSKQSAFKEAYNAQPADATAAATAATTLTNALRAYYESNAKAEGVTGATSVTITNGKVPETAEKDADKGVTKLDGWTSTLVKINGDAGYTLSDATASTTRYFDSNGDFWGSSSTTASISQNVTLEGGKYILSVMSRNSSDPVLGDFHLYAGDNTQALPTGSNIKGVFGNSWDCTTLVFIAPAGEITIGVSGTTKTTHSWFSCDNFQLYKIADLESVELKEDASDAPDATDSYANVTYSREFKTGWNSIILPFNVTATELTETLGADDAIKYDGTDGTTINFSSVKETGLTANTPYMIHVSSDPKTSVTFSGKKIAPTTELTTADGKGQYNFVGTYVQAETSPIEAGDYVVVSGGIQKAKGGNTLKAFRAYFDAQSAEATAKSFNFTIDGNVVTGVKAIELQNAVNDGAVYNLAGQRVSDSYKGVVIKNGKKYVK